MKRRAFAMTVSATILTLLAVFGITGAAHAKVTEFCNIPFSKAGFACFYSDGDWFKVGDNFEDGMRAVVIWVTDYGRSGECHDADGAANGYTWCNFNLAEGHTVVFSVVSRNGANGANKNESNVVIAYTSGR
jgi:hypothetical protein